MPKDEGANQPTGKTAGRQHQTTTENIAGNATGSDRRENRGALTRQGMALALHARMAGVTRRDAKALVDLVIEEMVAVIVSGETLKLHDFGVFLVRDKKARPGRDPRDGLPSKIDGRRIVTFKAAMKLKAVVNGEPLESARERRLRRAAESRAKLTE